MNRAQQDLVRRLAGHGSWMGRPEIDAGLEWTEQRIDDELADLVLSGCLLFNTRTSEYRLAGAPVGKTYQVGIARRVADPAGGEMLVMAELELGYPGSDAKAMQALVNTLCGSAL